MSLLLQINAAVLTKQKKQSRSVNTNKYVVTVQQRINVNIFERSSSSS